MKRSRAPFEGVLKKVDQFPCTVCPACGMVPAKFSFDDGDTVGGLDERLDTSRFCAVMMWGWCPLCGEKIFNIDLDILPDSSEDADFANDNYFKAEITEYYSVHIPDFYQWNLIHHVNVENLNYSIRQAKEEGQGFKEGRAKWLDMHMIGPFWVEADENPWDLARNILEKITPLLFRLDWVGGKWLWMG